MPTDNLLMAVVLTPFADDAVPQVEAGCVPVCDGSRELDAWEATGIRIAIASRTDIFIKQNAHWNAAWQCADCRGTGRLFHSRFGELRDIE